MPKLRPSQKESLVCGLVCFATALLSLGLFMLQSGGALTIREDFDFQQLPFTMALHNQIARGGLDGWCWNLDLGASAVQGFGFYELGSPFFWASMPFPAQAFPYLVGWLYMAKYTVAGLTSFWYARRLVGSSRAAMVCALLYAFSGFQTTNLLFYHFHDVVALFPTLLIGLERLMANKRDTAPFVLAVCVNALTNYFFFVQSFVFLLLYFGFRFAPSLLRKGRAVLVRAVGRCFALGCLGVGMAGALLVPSLVYMLHNPRAGSSALSLGNLVWDPGQLMFQLQGFLLPADAMQDHNAIISQQWTSTSCWLPLAGCTLWIAYLRKRRDWLFHLLVALLVVAASPLASSAFTLFTSIYQRWWYMLVLMLALTSAYVAEKPADYDLAFAAKLNLALVAAFVGIAVVAHVVLGAFGGAAIFHPGRFALYVGIALVGPLCTWRLVARTGGTSGAVGASGPSQGLGPSRTLVACIAACAVATTALTLHYYRQDLYEGELLGNISPSEQAMGTLNALELGGQLAQLDPQFRYATGDNRLTLPGNACGISSFSSTISAASAQFDELFDTPATNVWHLNKSTVPGLAQLLAARYHITTDPMAANVVSEHVVDGATYYVTAEDALPMGVLYSHYLAFSDIEALPHAQRALALLQAPVISPENEELAEGVVTRVSVDDLDFVSNVDALVRQASTQAVQDFWRDDHGFGFRTQSDSPALVYLAVPHDDGWVALVDGSPCDIADSAGMMALPLQAGTHEVTFRYETPGLRAGLLVSTLSWIIFAAWKFRLGAG